MNKKLRIGAFLVCILFVICMTVTVSEEKAPLTIHVLDVGQGDAILLRTAEGDVLIDAGTEESEAVLCLRLEQLGVRSLKLAVFTHLDEDHIGGADGVIRRFPTDLVWLGNSSDQNESSERLLDAISDTDTEALSPVAGASFALEALKISVLLPLTYHQNEGNAASIVILARYGTQQMLFMGDTGFAEEEILMERCRRGILPSAFLKVGHHGSQGSTSALFLYCVSPKYAVISCGAANDYGHPTGAVLSRIEASGARALRTDLLGELVFICDGETMTCQSHPEFNEYDR